MGVLVAHTIKKSMDYWPKDYGLQPFIKERITPPWDHNKFFRGLLSSYSRLFTIIKNGGEMLNIDQLSTQLNWVKSDNDYWFIHTTPPHSFKALPDFLGQWKIRAKTNGVRDAP